MIHAQHAPRKLGDADRRVGVRLWPHCVCMAIAMLLPHQASAQSAEARGWLKDLEVLARELPRRHVTPTVERPIDAFRADVEQLRDRIPSMSREAIIMEFARLAASFGDSHTELPLGQKRVGFSRFPLGLYFFGRDLRVIVVAPGNEDVLGLKLVAIGANKIDDVLARVQPFIADDHGNPYEILHSGPALITIPEVLRGLGLAQEGDTISYVFEADDGRRVTRTFGAISLQEVGQHMTARMVRPEQEPLFMRNRNLSYVMERVSSSDVLYVRVSRSLNQDGKESLAAFARTVAAAAGEDGVRHVVVDLRQNTGGNFHTTEPLSSVICGAAQRQDIGRVFVILGRHTYSAAVVLAGQLKHGCNAIFVGEVPRAVPNRQADAGEFTLPNSRLEISYSSKLRPVFPELGQATEIPLDIPAHPNWEDYRAGRDPALEAVFSSGTRARRVRPSSSRDQVRFHAFRGCLRLGWLQRLTTRPSHRAAILAATRSRTNGSYCFRTVLSLPDDAFEFLNAVVSLYRPIDRNRIGVFGAALLIPARDRRVHAAVACAPAIDLFSLMASSVEDRRRGSGSLHFLGRDDAFQTCSRDSTDTTQTIVEAKVRRLAAVRPAHRPRRTRPGLP
jgi:hypothetical protein